MKSNKGFSLVELIVVIAIMAIIAAVAIPVYSTYVTKAETATAQQKVDDAVYAAKLANVEFGTTAAGAIDTATKTVTITFTGADCKDAADQVATVISGATAAATATGTGDTATCTVSFSIETTTNVTITF